jgi:DNA-binding LacI/PurR family transcriptional regulator
MDDDPVCLNAKGFPMVLIHRTPPSQVPIPSKNIEITRSLMEHLIKVRGKRRILSLRGPINQEDSKRREVDVKPKKRNNVKGGENLRRICTLLPSLS